VANGTPAVSNVSGEKPLHDPWASRIGETAARFRRRYRLGLFVQMAYLFGQIVVVALGYWLVPRDPERTGPIVAVFVALEIAFFLLVVILSMRYRRRMVEAVAHKLGLANGTQVPEYAVTSTGRFDAWLAAYKRALALPDRQKDHVTSARSPQKRPSSVWWIHPIRFGDKVETMWLPRIGAVNAAALARAFRSVGLGALILGLTCVATISAGVIVSIIAASPVAGENTMMWGFLALGVGATIQVIGLRQCDRATIVIASRMRECDPHVTRAFARQALRSPAAFDRWLAQNPAAFPGVHSEPLPGGGLRHRLSALGGDAFTDGPCDK
jgi:hypothetical protein